MHRMACVNLPALPLQLVLRQHPKWKNRPVAVVDRDKPQGRILWVNEAARRSRILPGMRYAAALSLSGDLRASEVPSDDIDHAVESILTLLWKFSPEVEPSREEPGVFWLGATGLTSVSSPLGPVSSPLVPPKGTVAVSSPAVSSPLTPPEGTVPLYASLAEWAGLIRSSLESEEHLGSSVVVGFRKFATWALARSSPLATVFKEPADETTALRRVPLMRLTIDPEVRDTLHLLGVRLVGEFTDLPREGIEKRFGKDAWRLYRQAGGEIQEPLNPRPQETPIQKCIHLDDAETDQVRLMAVIERALEPLFKILTDRQQAVAEIQMHLQLDRAPPRTERLRPAAPTTDRAELGKLISLRLEKCLSVEPATEIGESGLGGGVTDLTLVIEGACLRNTQLELFQARPARDLGAANRALAFLRAKFGDEVVVRARLREAHLPEALFVWETFRELPRAAPLIVDSGMLVRRMYASPIELPARPHHEPDGWMLRGLEEGPVVRVLGPYIVSGGWWRKAAHREYHFAETQRGELLWVYYDRFRRRWFLQGRVE